MAKSTPTKSTAPKSKTSDASAKASAKADPAEIRAANVAALVEVKIAAGLTRAQAIEVAERQLDHDAAQAKAKAK